MSDAEIVKYLQCDLETFNGRPAKSILKIFLVTLPRSLVFNRTKNFRLPKFCSSHKDTAILLFCLINDAKIIDVEIN